MLDLEIKIWVESCKERSTDVENRRICTKDFLDKSFLERRIFCFNQTEKSKKLERTEESKKKILEKDEEIHNS